MSCRKSCKTQVNTPTSRCVLVDGKIGKHIVGRPKLCDTVLNTSTKRCVLRQNCSPHPKNKSKKNISKKGEKVKEAQKAECAKKKSKQKITPLCLPKKFEELANKCACNKEWIKGTKLGSGAYGTVHRCCKSGVCEYAIKKQKYDAAGKAEIEAYLSINKLNIAPKLYAAWVCRGQLYIVVEKLVKCKPTSAQLKPRIRRLLDKLEKHGWLHVDVHRGNVMCTDKGRTVLIDFGLAVQKGKGPYANHKKGATYEILKKAQELNLKNFHKSSTASRYTTYWNHGRYLKKMSFAVNPSLT